MREYACGFYRRREPFGEGEVQGALRALNELPMRFFPMSMWVSKDQKIGLSGPDALRREHVPAEYDISPGQAHIPLDCANGAELVFTESNQPTLVLASAVITFTDQVLRESRWTLQDLAALMRGVVPVFQPDVAELWDHAHRGRSSYQERMFDFDWRRIPLGLYWLNYYSRDWVANIGERRLRELSKHVPLAEWLPDGGVLIGIQEEPYDESNPVHRERQLFLEQKVFDLPGLQALFPNPGL